MSAVQGSQEVGVHRWHSQPGPQDGLLDGPAMFQFARLMIPVFDIGCRGQIWASRRGFMPGSLATLVET